MSRSIFLSVIISVLILGIFTLVSHEYRSTATQTALESPLVASSAMPTGTTDATVHKATVQGSAPTILFRQPAQEALRARQPTLYLAFDQPMDQASVAAALTVTPAVPLQLSWVGNTVYLVPAHPLEAGSRYTFTLSTAAHSSQGTPLAIAYTWAYRSPHTLAVVKQWEGFARDQPIVLTFSSSLNQAVAAQSLSLEPEIPFTVTWNADATQVTIKPLNPLRPATTYTLFFRRLLQDSAGYVVEHPRQLDFTTAAAVVAVEPMESNNINPATPIKVTFAPPFDPEATAATLQLTPPITGTVAWEGNTLLFTPAPDPFQPYTTYTLSVTPVSRAADDTLVDSPPYARSFTTGSLFRWADFGYGLKVQTVDAAGDRAIHYQSYHRPEAPTAAPPLTFALYPLELATFLAVSPEELSQSQTRIVSTNGIEATARWQETLRPPLNSNGGQSFVTTTIPATVPPGLYALNLETGHFNDQLLVFLTNHAVAVKQAAAQLTVWVTAMNDTVMAAMPVQVLDETGRVLAQGQTDSAGIWRAALAADAKPWLVVAQKGNDLSITGLRNEWRSSNVLGMGSWAPPGKRAGYTTYLYTDRPLYRPGQSVFFKAIVREDDDALLTTPTADTPVTLRVRDARNNIVRTYVLHTNAMGSVHGEFVLAPSAMLGDYALEAEIDGESVSQRFLVEEYNKPDYAVTVATATQHTADAQTVTVMVNSHYLNGRPVVNGMVTVMPYTLVANPYGYDSSSPRLWTSNFSPTTGMTDATGRFTTTFTFDHTTTPYYGAAGTSRWAIEATVNDGSNQSVSAVTLLDQPALIETVVITSDSAVKLPGELFYLTVGATNSSGVPAAYQRMRLTAETPFITGSSFSPGVQAMELTTNQSGQLRVPFLAENAGFYRFYLDRYDMKGYSTATPARADLLVYDPAKPWVEQPDGFLAISADRLRYAPGDEATLTIAASYGGPALLTLERGTVRRSQLIQLTPPLTTIPLPIVPEDAPNLFATVNVWTPPNPTRIAANAWRTYPDSHLRSATVELAVTPVNKQVTIDLTSDRTNYAPRAQATFQVQVRDAFGAPVTAELSLALVDEAIFQLSADLNQSIYDTFYARRPNYVLGYDGLAPLRWVGGGGGGGGGGFMPSNPRWNFPDTARWLPVIQTDADGKATVTVTLPDSLTSWRVAVKAVTMATQVGEATINVVTAQPISLQPLLPPVLTAGDQATLSALVHNDTAVTRTLTVTLAVSTTQPITALTLLAAPTQPLTLAPHTTGVVGWAVQAEAASTVPLVLSVATAEFSDAVQATLPIRPLAIRNLAVQVGQFTGEFTTAITLPTALTDLNTVQIELNRSVAGSILEGLEYLTGYPYGCVEQTMSRALPNAVVGRAFAQLGVGDPALSAQLPDLINAGLQQLYGFQHADGGWGWWFDDQSDPYQTAWVLFGLAVTADAGHEVDHGVIERGVTYLAERMATLDAQTRAFALYSIALTTPEPYVETIQTLAQEATQLDTFSQAALALALQRAGAVAQAEALVDQLAASATIMDGLVYWADGDADGVYQQKTMSSAIRSTALALSALIRIRPNHALEPGIVRWLMSKRQVQGWGTTNETAFTLLALTDHLLTTTTATAEAAYTIRLNDQEVGQGLLQPATPLGKISLDATQLTPGVNRLQIHSSNSWPLYYRITTQHYEMEAIRQRAGMIPIYREYIDLQTGRPITKTKAGQVVEVQLTVQMPQPASYMLIEDRLPGGLTAINERLTARNRGIQAYSEQPEVTEQYGYNYKDVRHDRVSFFFTDLLSGTQTITYRARAVTSGDFAALPTEAYAMYDEHIWGRAASTRFVIEE